MHSAVVINHVALVIVPFEDIRLVFATLGDESVERSGACGIIRRLGGGELNRERCRSSISVYIEGVMAEVRLDAGRQVNGRVACCAGALDDVPAARIESLRRSHLRAIYRDGIIRTGLIDNDLCLGRIDALRAVVGFDKAIISIIRLAFVGGGMTGAGLCALSGIRNGRRFAGRGYIAVPLIGSARHVTAFGFRHQGGVHAYRNGLRNRIQGMEERAAILIHYVARRGVTVAYYVVILVVKDMRTGRHFFRTEQRAGLGTCIRGKDKEGLAVLCAPPLIFKIPNTSGFLGGLDRIATVAEQRCRSEHTRMDLRLFSDRRGGVVPCVVFGLKLRKVIHRAVYIAFDMP